jgi:hypothetical protein
LTGATLGGFPSPLSYGYDLNGNRTSSGNGTTTLTNTCASTSNRLTFHGLSPRVSVSFLMALYFPMMTWASDCVYSGKITKLDSFVVKKTLYGDFFGYESKNSPSSLAWRQEKNGWDDYYERKLLIILSSISPTGGQGGKWNTAFTLYESNGKKCIFSVSDDMAKSSLDGNKHEFTVYVNGIEYKTYENPYVLYYDGLVSAGYIKDMSYANPGK